MRTALTLGLIAGSEVWEFIAGPETDIQEQRVAFKAFKRLEQHPKYAEVQLWESGAGIVSRRKYKSPQPLVEPAQAAAAPPVPAEAPSPESDDAEADFAVSPASKPVPEAEAPARRRKR